MKDDNIIIDFICDSLLPLALLFVVIICIILCFTMPVHAASDQYYFPMSQDENNKFDEAYLDFFNSYFDFENDYVFIMSGSWNGSVYGFYAVTIPKNADTMIYGEIFNNAYNFSLYKVGSYALEGYRVEARYTGSGFVYNNIYRNDFFGNLTSSNYSSDVSYLSNFQIYTNNNPATRKIVLLYGDGEGILGENDTIPDGTDKPVFDDYLPEDTNPPTFDNSSVEASLGSIFDYLQYETNKISGTISGIGNYLSDSLMWGLQMVINNIRNKISEMVEAIGDKIDEVKVGIGSIIDNIEDFVDYIKEPVDKQSIETALEGTTLYSVSSIGSSIKNIFSGYFDSIPQPDTLVFTIPYTILTKSGYITIDFSWYAGIRSSVLPWIVGFLYAGFALAIFRSIPSIIHGVSGVLQKGG